MKISIGSDHAGFEYKALLKKYLEAKNIELIDEGTYSPEPVDYPDFASKVGHRVADKEVDFGIVICGTGIGVSIAANKVHGVRAAVIGNAFTAASAKNHNHANVVAFGSRVNTIEEVKSFLDIYMNAEESKEVRHLNRIRKISDLEE